MTSSLIQIFAFMACTFVLGLFMGWALWRYGGVTSKAMETLKSEVDFWRGSHEKSRVELWSEQEKLTALREEKANLKKRLSAATS